MILGLEAALHQSEGARKALEDIAAASAGAAGGSEAESAESLAALQQQMAYLQVCSGSDFSWGT